MSEVSQPALPEVQCRLHCCLQCRLHAAVAIGLLPQRLALSRRGALADLRRSLPVGAPFSPPLPHGGELTATRRLTADS